MNDESKRERARERTRLWRLANPERAKAQADRAKARVRIRLAPARTQPDRAPDRSTRGMLHITYHEWTAMQERVREQAEELHRLRVDNYELRENEPIGAWALRLSDAEYGELFGIEIESREVTR